MDQIEFIQDEIDQGSSGGSDTIAIFLGLYLLILAFFIILVSISSTEELKAKAVQDSLTTTFAAILPQPKELSSYTGESGNIIAGEQFIERIQGLFAAAVQVAKVEVMQPGKHMKVTMPSDTLYFPDEARIRPAQNPLMDRIIASQSSSPPGLRYDVEFIIGSKSVPGGGLPIGQSLEMKRAGAFAREMRERGAPPDGVVIGMMAGDPKEVTLHFFVRDVITEPAPVIDPEDALDNGLPLAAPVATTPAPTQAIPLAEPDPVEVFR
ncbi:MAG: hypothetical protein OQK35_08490 [Alphaproteobacteria bacterium]|nr:hypothetical protein [Rhodospirillales bacterium]MCW9046357.1 hypothetical protein [Alphaproteobacteria bacterium]